MFFDISVFEVFNSIKFYSRDHTYKINDVVTPLSVTRFLNIFSPYFDTKQRAQKTALKQNIDVQTVLREWDYEKEVACFKGTILHNYIDNFLNKKILPLNKEEIDLFFKQKQKELNIKDDFILKIAKLIIQFKSFYNNFYKNRFIHFKSEYVVGDVDDTMICGTIDNLSVCKESNTLYILDYKTNKKFTTINNYNTYLNYPVNALQDTKLNIYSLQLSMYGYILQKYTNLTPKYILVWFNEENDTYKLYDGIDYTLEIKSMIDHYKFTNKQSNLSPLLTSTQDYIMSIGS